jgi:hypothetical protein
MKLHDGRLVTLVRLLDDVAPPGEHGENNEEEAGEDVPEMRRARLLRNEEHDRADGERQRPDRAHDRPRARIDEMIVMQFGVRFSHDSLLFLPNLPRRRAASNRS